MGEVGVREFGEVGESMRTSQHVVADVVDANVRLESLLGLVLQANVHHAGLRGKVLGGGEGRCQLLATA